jgi:hypothetical protein
MRPAERRRAVRRPSKFPMVVRAEPSKADTVAGANASSDTYLYRGIDFLGLFRALYRHHRRRLPRTRLRLDVQ